jgi:eukaryotic-like serine/threonine-protein kinase
VVDDDPVEKILRHAVDRGLLSDSQAASLQAEVSQGRRSSGETQQLGSGPRQPGAGSGATAGIAAPKPPTARPSGGSSPSGQPGAVPAEFPVPSWTRYEVWKLIGSGGMGHVFKARDPRLNRFVALKLLRRDDPDLLERFMREAQAQAQVEHANVCRVYEVGLAEGQPFIAMQLIAGRSLREQASELTLEQKVVVMRQVASAAHAAHRTGLVHRDLKPANILLERNEDGSWHPWVVDFGLAQSLSEKGLTSPGMVVGTAAYMAPEQARGSLERLDRRTDVYGIGATLYELLTGRPPFEAEHDVQILMLVLNSDPVPPRRLDRSIPVDLETIALKCLEKEPERRYESARAVAEELQRFLDGEPIVARRTSHMSRAARVARKHRTAAALLGAALALAATFAGVAVHARWQASAQARAAQEFGADASWIEEMLRRAYTAPPHDVRAERVRVSTRLEQIAHRMEGYGAVASGPGNYALGRGYLALEQYDKARTHLERAWADSFRGPEVAWALGRVMTALWEVALEQAQRSASSQERKLAQQAAEATFREPALRYLQASTQAQLDAPAYLEGLVAYLAEQREPAVAKAREAIAQVPWLYEAKKLEGEVYRSSGRRLLGLGSYDEALAAYSQAGKAFTEALDIGRSDAGVWESECGRRIEVVAVHLRRGQRPLDEINRAVEACTTVLRIDPDRSGAAAKLSRIYCTLADHQRDHGIDPRPVLNTAISTSRRAAAESHSSEAEITLGWALYQLGDYATAHGDDPRPELEESVAAFRRAILANPGAVEAWNALGYALDRRAKWEILQGTDPRATLDQAVAAYDRAAALDESFALPRNNLGIAHFRRAEVERRLGRDPRSDLEMATAAFHQALAINPNYAYAWYNLGGACRARATYLLESGQDPTPALDDARGAYAHGLAINPDVSWAYFERIETELVAARWALARGQSPAPPLAVAEAALAKAIELNPQGPENFVAGARLCRLQAETRLHLGQDPTGALRRGLELAAGALAIHPGRGDALAVKGALLGALALQGHDARSNAELQEACEILRRALQANQFLRREYGSVLGSLERAR